MIVQKTEPELQEADILVRPKKSGSGYHYGTVVRTESVVRPFAMKGIYPKFLAAHTMPGVGKHPATIDRFFEGMPGWRIRPQRGVLVRQVIEQRAISDFGRPYSALDNCETDVNRVHTGIATSPTVNRVAWGIAIGVLLKILGDI